MARLTQAEYAALDTGAKFEYAKAVFARMYRECKYADLPAIVKYCNNGKSWGFNSQERFTKQAKEKNQKLKFVAIQYIVNKFAIDKIETALDEKVWETMEWKRTRNVIGGVQIDNNIDSDAAAIASDVNDEDDSSDDNAADGNANEPEIPRRERKIAQQDAEEKGRSSVSEARIREIAAEGDVKVIQTMTQAVTQLISEMNKPTVIHISRNLGDQQVITPLGLQHKDFPELLELLQVRDPDDYVYPVWMPGPAGSGKTTAAKNAARAMELKFYHTGAVDTEYKLLGFVNATGQTIRTAFREAYEHGGVFLFDEVDASNPAALVALNAALENGSCAFPDGNIDRHRDCIVIAAANTFGGGATHEYVGRTKIDAATVDRFIMLEWQYDNALESAIAQDDEWVAIVQKIRRAVIACGIKHIVSPRASYRGARMRAAGMSIDTCLNRVVWKGMAPDQIGQVKRNAGMGF